MKPAGATHTLHFSPARLSCPRQDSWSLLRIGDGPRRDLNVADLPGPRDTPATDLTAWVAATLLCPVTLVPDTFIIQLSRWRPRYIEPMHWVVPA
jgi:hypothetical protein